MHAQSARAICSARLTFTHSTPAGARHASPLSTHALRMGGPGAGDQPCCAHGEQVRDSSTPAAAAACDVQQPGSRMTQASDGQV